MRFKWISRMRPREQLFAGATAGVAVLCLFVRLAAMPVLERLDSLQREVALRLKQRTAYQRSIAQQEEILRAAGRYEYMMQTDASDDEVASQLLKEVESVARTAQVTVVNLKPRPPETAQLVKWYRVAIDTESSLEALTRFIYELEQSAQLLRVERLDVKQDEKLQGPLKCTLQVSRVVIP